MSSGGGSSWLHRYTVFFAACALFLILAGAAVTSTRPQLPAATSPSITAPPQTAETTSLEQAHRMAGFIVMGLGIGLAVWLSVAEKRGWLRWLGWSLVGALILDIGFGEIAAAQKLSGVTALFHAYLAHLLFSSVAGVMVFTSPSWNHGPELVAERFSLRAMALALPALVILQVGLGAAYRHQAMGVLTHIFGALVVAVFVLLVGVLAVKQYPDHGAIRTAAVTLMSITGAQVLLGFAAFLTRLMTTVSKSAVVFFTVAHVVTGALTLAASVVVAIQIRRNVTRAAEQPTGQRANPLPS